MISKLRLMVMSHLTCERECVCGGGCLCVGVPLDLSHRSLKIRTNCGALGGKAVSLVPHYMQQNSSHLLWKKTSWQHTFLQGSAP